MTDYNGVVTKTGNDHKQSQTTTNPQQTIKNDHTRPQTILQTTSKQPQNTTNHNKSLCNDHKPPQTTTNHQQTTTLKIKSNKNFPNSNYLVFFVNCKQGGA